MCQRPQGAEQNSMLMRRLPVPLIGKEDLAEKGIHPQLHQAFKRIPQEQSAPAEGVERLWRLGAKERMLQPGEIACIKGTVKLIWSQLGTFVVLETDVQEGTAGVELVPEIVPTKALFRM